jgi:hypothetical protein
MQILLPNTVLLYVLATAMEIIVLILVSKIVLLSIQFRLMLRMAIIFACLTVCPSLVLMPTLTLNVV